MFNVLSKCQDGCPLWLHHFTFPPSTYEGSNIYWRVLSKEWHDLIFKRSLYVCGEDGLSGGKSGRRKTSVEAPGVAQASHDGDLHRDCGRGVVIGQLGDLF